MSKKIKWVDMPNVFLVGGSGSGKTNTAKILVKDAKRKSYSVLGIGSQLLKSEMGIKVDRDPSHQIAYLSDQIQQRLASDKPQKPLLVVIDEPSDLAKKYPSFGSAMKKCYILSRKANVVIMSISSTTKAPKFITQTSTILLHDRSQVGKVSVMGKDGKAKEQIVALCQ